MNFYIRTNYGNDVGMGHVSRVSSILNDLKKHSHKYLIFGDKSDEKIKNLIKNHRINSLYTGDKKFKNQSEDAKIFLSKITNLPKGIIIVDDYRIDFVWEKHVSNFCYKIIAIDDFFNKKHFVDILVNTKPSLSTISHKDFNNLKLINKKNCQFLLGPKYAPINNKLTNERKFTSKFNLVFYNGGAGNPLIYYNVIKEILKKYNYKKKIEIHLVIGLLVKNKNKIKKLFFKHKNIKIHQNLNNLNKLLSNSHLLISSAGLISLESAFYKIPTILIQMSKNQKVDNISMQSIGHYFVLKKEDLINYQKFSKLINILIIKYNRLKKLCSKPKIQIDGNGVKRILEIILNKKEITQNFLIAKTPKSKKANELKVREITDKDINYYINARNLNINIINTSTKKKVNLLDHFIWWFTNDSRKSYLVKRDDTRLIILTETYHELKGKNFVIPGLISCASTIPIIELLWSINWQKKNIDKHKEKLICIATAPKDNFFSNIHTKYFGWQKTNEKNKDYLTVNKYLNAKNCNIYIRYVNYEKR